MIQITGVDTPTAAPGYIDVTGKDLASYIGWEVLLSFGHNDHSFETIEEVDAVSEGRWKVSIHNTVFYASANDVFQIRRIDKTQPITPAPTGMSIQATVSPPAWYHERDKLMKQRDAQIRQPHYPLSDLYMPSLAPLTDEYNISMAYVHWWHDHFEKEAVFNYGFRNNPFGGGYALCSGLTHTIDYLTHYRWEQKALENLANKKGNDGKRLYEPAFLDYLASLKLRGDMFAFPEGSVGFQNETIIRYQGSVIEGHLVDTALLTLNNFNTLCATKASRIVYAAGGKPVSDQSLRRDQGPDGAMTVAWASFVGGCVSTSNLLAGTILSSPSQGTMAHAFIMVHADELDAFFAFSDAIPNNSLFLVDTNGTPSGIRNAIIAGQRLRARGYEMVGIRLDSGDLAKLSKMARRMLGEAGFPNVMTFSSNNLNEYVILSLREQGALIDAYGVGTQMGTCYDQPALDGVNKIGAYRNNPRDDWKFPIKVADSIAKISTPGSHQVRRFIDSHGKFIADIQYNTEDPPSDRARVHHMVDFNNKKWCFKLGQYASYHDLQVPIMSKGKIVYQNPHLTEIQAYAQSQLTALDEGHRRFLNADLYPVGLDRKLYRLKKRSIERVRSLQEAA